MMQVLKNSPVVAHVVLVLVVGGGERGNRDRERGNRDSSSSTLGVSGGDCLK